MLICLFLFLHVLTLHSCSHINIPPALYFDHKKFYKENHMKCMFIDYSTLRVIVLEGTYQHSNYNISFCQKDSNYNTVIHDSTNKDDNLTITQFTFNTSSPSSFEPNTYKLTALSTSSSTVNIIITCNNNNNTNIIKDDSSHYTITIENHSFCKQHYYYQYTLYYNCGIFGYIMIFLGLFTLLYGYSNIKLTLIIYSIVFVFELVCEVQNLLVYNFNFYINNSFFNIIIALTSLIFGALIGYTFTRSITFKKILLSYFLSKICYLILYYSFFIKLEWSITHHFVFVLFMIGLLMLVFVFCIKEKNKCDKLIMVLAIAVIGSYVVVFQGINLIGGGFPFEYVVLYAMKYNHIENNYYNSVISVYNCLGCFVYFVVLVLGGITVTSVGNYFSADEYNNAKQIISQSSIYE